MAQDRLRLARPPGPSRAQRAIQGLFCHRLEAYAVNGPLLSQMVRYVSARTTPSGAAEKLLSFNHKGNQ